MGDKPPDEAQSADSMSELRTRWSVAKPTRDNYANVVSDINATKLVGEASIFERGTHVTITHMGYFKHSTDAFLVELRLKDRRTAKEWEYINEAWVWAETSLSALSLCKESETSTKGFARNIEVAEEELRVITEVLSIRDQIFSGYNRERYENGMTEAHQMAYLVEQEHKLCNKSRTVRLEKPLQVNWKQKLRSSLQRKGSRELMERRKAVCEVLPTLNNERRES